MTLNRTQKIFKNTGFWYFTGTLKNARNSKSFSEIYTQKSLFVSSLELIANILSNTGFPVLNVI